MREQPERRIIVDLAAQTHRFLAQWMEDSELLEIRDELDVCLRELLLAECDVFLVPIEETSSATMTAPSLTSFEI